MRSFRRSRDPNPGNIPYFLCEVSGGQGTPTREIFLIFYAKFPAVKGPQPGKYSLFFMRSFRRSRDPNPGNIPYFLCEVSGGQGTPTREIFLNFHAKFPAVKGPQPGKYS